MRVSRSLSAHTTANGAYTAPERAHSPNRHEAAQRVEFHGEMMIPDHFNLAHARTLVSCDYDDTITSEQADTYVTAHNAVALAALRHADHYPILHDIDTALRKHHTDKGPYRAGMPILCMTEGAYVEHGLLRGPVTMYDATTKRTYHAMVKTPSYFTRPNERGSQDPHMMTDLVNTLEHLDWHIGQKLSALEREKPDARRELGQLLYDEFMHTYHEVIRPPRRSPRMHTGKISKRKRSATQPYPAEYQPTLQTLHEQATDSTADLLIKKQRDLPYPKPTKQFMPGALELLKLIDRPDTLSFLISNREHSLLVGELERLTREHPEPPDFHAVYGLPSVHDAEKGDITYEFLKTSDTPPERNRFLHALEHLPIDAVHRQALSDAKILAIGDSITDISYLNRVKARYIHGVVVNPKYRNHEYEIPAGSVGSPAHADGIAGHIAVTYIASLEQILPQIPKYLNSVHDTNLLVHPAPKSH